MTLDIIRRYPLPSFALVGLIAGSLLFIASYVNYANLLWFVVLLIGGAPVVFKTTKKVMKGRFASDIVATLAILVALIITILSLFNKGFPSESFPGVIIVLMQTGGEALEDYGFRRASSSLEELSKRSPKLARRKVDSHIEEIDANEVKVGDILVIRHGDLIPVDGLVIGETAYVDESALTGEPIPKSKADGEKVLSGSINVGRTFEIRTEKISKESQYAKIVEMVRSAQKDKPQIQRLADKYAVWFTPLTLIISLIGYIITGKVTTVLAVLVVATPCPLIIAVPIAVIAGINKASNEGIIVKNGAAIEQIGNARAAFFDKTGTITFGAPSVEDIIPLGKHTKKELLYKSACVEQLSTHPLANAIVAMARKESKKLEIPKKFKEVPSRGVEGHLGKDRIAVGSRKFHEEISKTDYSNILEKTVTENRMYSLIAINKELAGIIVFTDKIRHGVPKMVQRLRGLGVEEIKLITGDNIQNAKIVADQAGISDLNANLLPADKVRIIKETNRKFGTTVMIGDGINDAPALATATIGVAMGAHGTGISAEAADVVLLVDDVTKVTDAISIGRRMSHIAKQSIYVGLGLSIGLMIIAAFGYIVPAIGAVLQEAIDVTVILNALRAR